MSDVTDSQIAELIRKKYPDAKSITLFVNCYDHEITVCRRDHEEVGVRFKLCGEYTRKEG